MFIPNQTVDLYKLSETAWEKDFVLDSSGLGVYISPLGDEYRAMNNITGWTKAFELFSFDEVFEAGDKVDDGDTEYKVVKVNQNSGLIKYTKCLIVEQYD